MEGWPIPTLMIAGGAALGILLAITAKFIYRRRGPSPGRRQRASASKQP